jgi:hypothetical protein
MPGGRRLAFEIDTDEVEGQTDVFVHGFRND